MGELDHLLPHGVEIGEKGGILDLSAFAESREDMITHDERERLLESCSRFDIVPAGRRCLAEGTLVATPSGPRKVEDLKPGDEVIGFENGQPHVTHVAEFFDNGVQEVMGLSNRRSGKPLFRCTPNHKLWACHESDFDKREGRTAKGYRLIKAGSITPRHRVRRCYVGDMIQGGEKHVPMAYSLGAMIGDGHCREQNMGRYESRKTTLTIGSDDRIVPEAIAAEIGGEATKNKGNNYSWSVRYKPGYVLDRIPFYREWCHGRYAHEKVVDWAEVDTWDRESALALLAGIVDTNGSIYSPSGMAELKIQIGMQAKSVVEACQKIIHKYFGAVVTIYEDRRERYKNGSVWYIRSASNRLSREILAGLQPLLRKRGVVDLESFPYGVDKPDRETLFEVGDRAKVRTYDIRVANSTNLFALESGVIVKNSGKTVEARHRLIFGDFHMGGNHHGCLCPIDVAEPIYVYCAPTYAQAKRIAWSKIKAEIPKWAISKKSESDLEIEFVTGAKLMVIGMDKPERIEGIAVHGIVLDEFADMKPTAWTSSIRPALSTRGQEGWALFIGRPRGKNHFYQMFQEAQVLKKEGESWDVYYPWPSWMVMSDEEILAAKRELDDRAFRQEYGGEFLDSGGRVAYQFGEWNQADVRYDPSKALQFSFDFNVSPGVAVVAQDYDMSISPTSCHRCHTHPGASSGESCRFCGVEQPFETITACIGEVWIEEGSNTRQVCERLIRDWGDVHKGAVICYGDVTGGARKTSSERSDWQIIEDYLCRKWPNLTIDIDSVNPLVRDRTVVMNSRLRNALDVVRVLINPKYCKHLCQDLDLTEVDKNGDIDEGPLKMRGHILDALAYLLYTRFGNPIHSNNKEGQAVPL